MRLLIFVLLLGITQTVDAIVIGKDDRVKVNKHSKETWGVGVVYAEYPGHGFYKCSGTLISHYHVLTSAHCTYNVEYGGFPKQISFVPRVLKTQTGTNTRFFAKNAWINQSFITYKNKYPQDIVPKSDIAFLTLMKNQQGDIPGKVFGYKGFASPKGNTKNLSIVAYKNEGKDAHTLYRSNNCSAQRYPWDSWDLWGSVLSTTCDTSVGSSGAALLNKDKKIIGVLVGQYNYERNLFTALSEDYLNSIDALKKGNKPSKNFKKHEFDTSMYFSVHFKNSCHKKLYIAYSYKSLDGEWITDGFKMLKPKEVLHNVFQTQNTVLAFYAQTYNGDLKWSGDDYKLKVQGKEHPFYRKDLPQKFTDQTFSWSCSV